MIYYIADLHFGHKKVIKFCNRPFSSPEEMDRKLIENWRATVRAEDDVYVLGDLIFKPADPIFYLEQLAGRIHLIKGNHDHFLKNKECPRCFASVDDMLTIKDEGRRVFMAHYPFAEWRGYFRGTIHLFGHIHNAQNAAFHIMNSLPNNYNVGADCIGFTPRTLTQIIEIHGKPPIVDS